MKLSFCVTPRRTVFAPLLYSGDIERGLRRAAEIGYQAVEPNLRDPTAENTQALLALAQELGLGIVAVGTGQAYLVDGLSAASPDPDVRARCVERLKRQADFAAQAGAQLIFGGVRGRLEGATVDRRSQYEYAASALQQVADYAAQQGVKVTVEPINRYETNFLNTVDEALAFLAVVDRPAVGLLLDTFHMNIEEVSICGALERAGTRLSHVHLVDSNRRAPGMGHTDMRSVIATLRAIGYDGYLSGEFLPLPDDDTAVQHNYNYVRQLLAA